AFAEALTHFPTGANSEYQLVCGAKDPAWHDYLRMQASLIRATGQSVLEIESQVRGSPPATAECHFYVAGMPADFNAMGAAISAWVQNPREMLHVEWKNG